MEFNVKWTQKTDGPTGDDVSANDFNEAFASVQNVFNSVKYIYTPRIFRGKNLGSSVTDSQISAIRSGTFEGLFLGDYWEIGGIVWRIVDFDYWLGKFNYMDFENYHHLVIMPDTILYNAVMNATHTTEGAYMNSDMYKTGLDEAIEIIQNIFGDKLWAHTTYLENATSEGRPVGVIYSTGRQIDLPNEIMIYGSHIKGSTCVTECHTQFALFATAPRFVQDANRNYYWLRTVVDKNYFASVGQNGYAGGDGAACIRGVRPVFCIR